MKIDLNLEPKDYIKFAVLAGAVATTMLGDSNKKAAENERLAVLETEVRSIKEDVQDIKAILTHNPRRR